MKITNISPGPRGVNTKSGVVHLAPGETRDLELESAEAKSLSDEWFKTGAVSKADAAKAAEEAAAAAEEEAKKRQLEEDQAKAAAGLTAQEEADAKAAAAAKK